MLADLSYEPDSFSPDAAGYNKTSKNLEIVRLGLEAIHRGLVLSVVSGMRHTERGEVHYFSRRPFFVL